MLSVKILVAMSVNIAIFWAVTWGSLVKNYGKFVASIVKVENILET
jgi:ABC-type proline/glycine betaine transport system permease subunit